MKEEKIKILKTVKMEGKRIVIYQVKMIQIVVMMVRNKVPIRLLLRLEKLRAEMRRRKRRIKIKSCWKKKQELGRVKYQIQKMIQVILDLNRMIPLLSNAERNSMVQIRKRKIKKEQRINLQLEDLHLIMDRK